MDGEKQTHNPSGRATAAVVWEHYKVSLIIRGGNFNITEGFVFRVGVLYDF